MITKLIDIWNQQQTKVRKIRALPPRKILRVLLGTGLFYGIIILAMAVIIVPVFIVIFVSFNPTAAEVFPPEGLSLRWYYEFFQIGEVAQQRHARFFPSFFYISLPVALVTGFVATAIGILGAYSIVRSETRFSTEMQTFVLAPLIFPSVIIGISLFVLFITYDIGRLPYKLNLIAGHILIALPYTTLIAAASLYSVNEELELAARNLGANKYMTFLKITLPLMKSGIIAAFLLGFMISFSDINVALFLAHGDNGTFPLEIFRFLTFDSNPIIAAGASVAVVLVLVLVIAVHYLVGFKTVIEET